MSRNLENRITQIENKLEQQPTVNVSDVNLELFDVHGNKVNAKILRLPMNWEGGLAEAGTEVEIACLGNWEEIIFASERLLMNSEIPKRKEEQEDYSQMLFLRQDEKLSAVELIYGATKK